MSDPFRDDALALPDGRRIGFTVYGATAGTPIVFLHGTPGCRFHGFERDPLVARLGLRIIAPERPGYGVSDPVPGRRIVDHAPDILALADALGVDAFHVAGGSGGGPYALACAVVAPDRVRSVSLLSSATPTDLEGFTRGMGIGNAVAYTLLRRAPILLWPLLALSASQSRKDPLKSAELGLAQLSASDQAALKAAIAETGGDTIANLIREAHRQGAAGVYSDMRAQGGPWGFDIARLTRPTVMWHGEDDRAVPPHVATAFAKRLPGCERRFIPGVGHLLTEDDSVREQIFKRILELDRAA
jgi:pimeloyl-ACP methyl ester carboxylesterase